MNERAADATEASEAENSCPLEMRQLDWADPVVALTCPKEDDGALPPLDGMRPSRLASRLPISRVKSRRRAWVAPCGASDQGSGHATQWRLNAIRRPGKP